MKWRYAGRVTTGPVTDCSEKLKMTNELQQVVTDAVPGKDEIRMRMELCKACFYIRYRFGTDKPPSIKAVHTLVIIDEQQRHFRKGWVSKKLVLSWMCLCPIYEKGLHLSWHDLIVCLEQTASKYLGFVMNRGRPA